MVKTSLRLLTVLNAALLFAAFGCGGDDKDGGGGGCGPPPAKKEEAGGGGGGTSGNKGGGGGQAQWITSDKRGRVPKPYQRAKSAYEPAKTAEAPAPAAASGAPAAGPAAAKSKPPIWRITKRGVDGVEGRLQVSCRIMASSPDGQCSGAANFAEIKERCCPGGVVERCTTGTSGVVLIGRDCGS